MFIGHASRPAALLATLVLIGVGSAPARAQHVVTEAEAAKLTLEALTAAPPPPRPIYRSYIHRVSARGAFHRGWYRRDEGWSGARVREVAERHAVHRAMGGHHRSRVHR